MDKKLKKLGLKPITKKERKQLRRSPEGKLLVYLFGNPRPKSTFEGAMDNFKVQTDKIIRRLKRQVMKVLKSVDNGGGK